MGTGEYQVCDKCHKECEDNSKFCPECGELLQEMNSFKEYVMIII